jgi:hypothetical protein
MVDEARSVGIRQQIDELVVDVAVVDVERRHPGAKAPEHRLDVLGRVQHVEPDVVLAGLVVREPRALVPTAEALGVEDARETARALGERPIGDAPRRRDDRLPLRIRGGESLIDAGEVHAADRTRDRPASARTSGNSVSPGREERAHAGQEELAADRDQDEAHEAEEDALPARRDALADPVRREQRHRSTPAVTATATNACSWPASRAPAW